MQKRVENYFVLGVVYHPDSQILGHCFSGKLDSSPWKHKLNFIFVNVFLRSNADSSYITPSPTHIAFILYLLCFPICLPVSILHFSVRHFIPFSSGLPFRSMSFVALPCRPVEGVVSHGGGSWLSSGPTRDRLWPWAAAGGVTSDRPRSHRRRWCRWWC